MLHPGLCPREVTLVTLSTLSESNRETADMSYQSGVFWPKLRCNSLSQSLRAEEEGERENNHKQGYYSIVSGPFQ